MLTLPFRVSREIFLLILLYQAIKSFLYVSNSLHSCIYLPLSIYLSINLSVKIVWPQVCLSTCCSRKCHHSKECIFCVTTNASKERLRARKLSNYPAVHHERKQTFSHLCCKQNCWDSWDNQSRPMEALPRKIEAPAVDRSVLLVEETRVSMEIRRELASSRDWSSVTRWSWGSGWSSSSFN